MRIAIIDIGTNTVLMLMAERSTGALIILRDEHSIARLGEGVDKTKRISETAYDRFTEILRRYKQLIAKYEIDRVVAFATSAMRDAENRDEIIDRVQKEFDIAIELLSGNDEARWSFQGALFGAEKISGKVSTIDIGGGSTEVSFGTAGAYGGMGVWRYGKSVDIGAVRIKEKFLSDDLHVDEAREYIHTELSTITLSDKKVSQLIAVAGTPTSLAAMKHRLTTFDTQIVDGTIVTTEELKTMIGEMFSITTEQLMHRYPVVSPARADILPAGALILQEAIALLGVDSFRVSTKGLRYGILLREVAQ